MSRWHRRFRKEFEAEAIRLVETSGRSQHEIAEDPGIGPSTLQNWLTKQQDRNLGAAPPRRQQHLAAELTRLQHDNDVLHQEREILQKVTAFFDNEGGR